MTCIVNFPTKKAFKEAVANGASMVRVEDPSIHDPFSGMLERYLDTRGECYVTNHPKRSWFARVYRKGDKVVVE